MFQHIDPYTGDPIFAVVDAFQADQRPNKVNLSIGIYFDDEGQIPVLPSIQAAEKIIADNPSAKNYLPMEGDPECCAAVGQLLLGAQHLALQENRVVTIQTIGSSGGLKVGADFLRTWLPNANGKYEVWVSNPTWDNHRSLFEGSGFQVHSYPYYDAQTGGLQFEALIATLSTLPARSVVLLHACCHNPTGVDLTPEQWDTLIPILRSRELLPFLDIAYQGFGAGIEADAYAIQAMADAGITFLVANSFSKSMSVYGERCGALTAVCSNAAEAQLVLGQLRYTVRRIYSSPGLHAGKLVAQVLKTPSLRAMWEAELNTMRQRILFMRQSLYQQLTNSCPYVNFDYLIRQQGMFSYTGLSPAQVQRLRDEHAIYLIGSGRLCVAGLNTHNIDQVAQGLAAVAMNH
jgi:aromatic-amino-acid transaminase